MEKVKTFTLKKLLFLIFVSKWLLWCQCTAIAQQNTRFTGSIIVIDSLNKPVRFFYVKIEKTNPAQIIFFKNSGDTNVIALTPNGLKNDTVTLSIQAQGFQPLFATLTLGELTTWSNKAFTLQYRQATLPGAVVQAPATWVRGDTTFFKADKYTQPGENKLKDIITRMPGFEITQDGRLLFKKMPVQKMTVNGEDIFSERLDMLMKNFPLHVLENVQALENQQSNPALKGLKNERLVYVNLELKKQGVKAAFGDGEVGVGTQGRYLFNPVLFALYKKVKGGFIANYNSQGTGFDWKQERELKNDPERKTEDWMARSNLLVINNVEARRYILNGLADNRLQMNIPLCKKTQLQNEFTIVADRQQQQSYFNNSFISNVDIFSRFDSTQFSASPLLFKYNGKSNIQPSERTFIKTKYAFNVNLNSIGRNTIYGFENNIQDFTREQMKNKAIGSLVQIELTTRKSAVKATNLIADLSFQSFTQNIKASGPNLGIYFDSLANYNRFFQNPIIEQWLATVRNEWLTKGKKRLWQYGVQMEYMSHKYTNMAYLSPDTLSNNRRPLDWLNNRHHQNTLKSGTYVKQMFDFNKLSISVDVSGGLITSKVEQFWNKDLIHQQLWYDFVSEARLKISKRQLLTLRTNHFNDMRQPSNWVSGLRPVSVLQFHQFRQSTIPQSVSNFVLAYSGSIKQKISFNFYGTWDRTWKATSMYQQLQGIIQVSVDSFTNLPVNNFSVNTAIHYHDLASKLHIQLSGFGSYTQILFTQGSKSGKGINSSLGTMLRVTKNWSDKLQFDGNGRFYMTKVTLPAIFSSNFTAYVGEVWLSSKLQFQLLKQVRVKVITDQFYNNLFTINRASFFMSDAECIYSKDKSKYTFTLRLENITNTNRFIRNMNTAVSQSFFSIPFVPRNISLLLRYQF